MNIAWGIKELPPIRYWFADGYIQTEFDRIGYDDGSMTLMEAEQLCAGSGIKLEKGPP